MFSFYNIYRQHYHLSYTSKIITDFSMNHIYLWGASIKSAVMLIEVMPPSSDSVTTYEAQLFGPHLFDCKTFTVIFSQHTAAPLKVLMQPNLTQTFFDIF